MYVAHVHFASKHLSGMSAAMSQDTHVLLTVPSIDSSMDAMYITMSSGSPMQLHYCYHNHAPTALSH